MNEPLTGFIQKPYEPRTLVEKLNEILGINSDKDLNYILTTFNDQLALLS